MTIEEEIAEVEARLVALRAKREDEGAARKRMDVLSAEIDEQVGAFLCFGGTMSDHEGATEAELVLARDIVKSAWEKFEAERAKLTELTAKVEVGQVAIASPKVFVRRATQTQARLAEKEASRARIDALLPRVSPDLAQEIGLPPLRPAPVALPPAVVTAKAGAIVRTTADVYADPGPGYGPADDAGLAKHLVCKGRGCGACAHQGIKRCGLRPEATESAQAVPAPKGVECRACGKRARPSCTRCGGTGYELDSLLRTEAVIP